MDTLKNSLAELKDLLRSLSTSEEITGGGGTKKCGETGHIRRFCVSQRVTQRKCWSCGDVGHIYRHCNSRKPNYSSGHDYNNIQRRCWSCGDTGHIYRHCNSRRQRYSCSTENQEPGNCTERDVYGKMRVNDEMQNDEIRR